MLFDAQRPGVRQQAHRLARHHAHVAQVGSAPPQRGSRLHPGHDRDQQVVDREDAQHPPEQEPPDRLHAPALGQEDPGDQEAAQHEEDLDPQVPWVDHAPREPEPSGIARDRQRDVPPQDEQHGDRPEPVERWYVLRTLCRFRHGRRGLGAATRRGSGGDASPRDDTRDGGGARAVRSCCRNPLAGSQPRPTLAREWRQAHPVCTASDAAYRAKQSPVRSRRRIAPAAA